VDPPTLEITGPGQIIVEATPDGKTAKAGFPGMEHDDNFEPDKVGTSYFLL
jgi:hypothetical protein